MARNKARPGRTVTVFFIGLALAYGLVALIGTWKPALGLDLEGGTQIVLTAKGNVSKDNLNEAADIIDSRVNGSGVTEATVNTQGNNQIVVQVPGATQDNLVETVVRQAQLRFRLVAQVPQSTTPGAAAVLHAPLGDRSPVPTIEAEATASQAGKNRPPRSSARTRHEDASEVEGDVEPEQRAPTSPAGSGQRPRPPPARWTTRRRTRRPTRTR